MPLIGRHWVIDSPDSVRRVMPPTTTIATTSRTTAISQRAMLRGPADGLAFRSGGTVNWSADTVIGHICLLA